MQNMFEWFLKNIWSQGKALFNMFGYVKKLITILGNNIFENLNEFYVIY